MVRLCFLNVPCPGSSGTCLSFPTFQRQKQTDLCEFKASLHKEFWDSQSYNVKPCLKKIVIKYYIVLNFLPIHKTNDRMLSNVLSMSIYVHTMAYFRYYPNLSSSYFKLFSSLSRFIKRLGKYLSSREIKFSF